MATWKKLLHESSPAGDFPTLNQSTTGNAGTATTLANGRTLKVSLGSTSASTAFDGSANITDIGVSGTLGVGYGGTGLSSYTSGDILYASGSTTLAKLAKGTDGQVLSLASGVPSWADASSGDVTGIDGGNGITINDGGTSTPEVALDAALTTVTSIYNGALSIGAGSGKARIQFGTADINFGADASHITLVLENVDATNNEDTLRPKSHRGVNLGDSTRHFNNFFTRQAIATDAIIGTIKIGDASTNTTVTSTAAELNILDGVTADKDEINILDGATVTTAELNILDGVTATATELNYVDGVTSNIQTQLDAKQASGSYQATITGAATTIDTENLTASRALVSNGSGKVAVSAVTSTELGYLDGVSSNIQSQLGLKAAKAGTSSQDFAANNLTVAGNLTVSGTSTIQNSTVETVNISDAQLKLGAGLSGTSRDLALVFDRGGANAVAEGVVTTNGLDAALFYDATTGFLSMAGVPTTLNEGDNTPDDISGVSGVENIKQVLLGSSSTSPGSGDQAPIGSIHVDTDDDSGTPYMRIA